MEFQSFTFIYTYIFEKSSDLLFDNILMHTLLEIFLFSQDSLPVYIIHTTQVYKEHSNLVSSDSKFEVRRVLSY